MNQILPAGVKLAFSVFTSLNAKDIHRRRATWEKICDVLRKPPELPDKASCPLIKLAIFGDTRTPAGSLRSNGNMTSVTGIEADYDAGQVPIQQAADMLQAAGIECCLYSSPSSTPTAPRWRVLAPLSRPYPPNDRRRFVQYLNDALCGICAPESFTPSQAYYFGRVSGAQYEFVPVNGQRIDLLTPASTAMTNAAVAPGLLGCTPVPEHLRGKQLDEMTQNLAKFKPKSFALLLESSLAGTGCAQIADIYTNQATCDEPRWRSGLSIAAHCQDANSAIHNMSAQHTEYDHEKTIKKAAQIPAPYTCAAFDTQRPDLCTGCQHKGKLVSPIVLGIDGTTVSAPQDTLEDSATIARLAALSKLEYDRVRTGEAKAMGVRTVTLDAMIEAARKERQENSKSPFVAVEPWETPVDLAELLRTLSATVRRFIVCEPDVAHAAALWAAFTWVHDAFQIAPLAVVTAPEKRCGKSEFRRLLAKFVNRPLEADGMSASVLFRGFNLWKPTLLVDEYDTFVKDDEDLRGIFNAGHQRGGCIWRCVGEDHEPARFDVFGPKLLAGIGSLPGTMMDRAIIFELRRKLAHEPVERLRYADASAFDTLRRKLARFAQDHIDTLQTARPDMPEALNDRAQDNWEPLLAIADLAGGTWPELARAAALALSADKESTSSMATELLSDIREVFTETGMDKLFSFQLVGGLCKDDRRWTTHNRGGNISVVQVARILNTFNITPKSMRIGHDNAKGYAKEQFVDAWARYLPPSHENSRHNVTNG